MAKPKLRVAITRKLPEAIETRMTELFDVRLRESDTPMSREQLAETARESEVLVCTITDQIDKELLENVGNNLKLIANYGAGVDNIDIQEARKRGILVSNTPGVVTADTADMVVGLILAVSRRLREAMRQMQTGDWPGWAPTALMGVRIGGKKLGILGMGRIGRAAAERAKVFGMQIHYHNRKRVHPDIENRLEATYWASLDQMVSRMDFLSINCPHTPATYHLMNARRLKLMKPEAVIVNTSRGEVIDQNALTRMLRANEIGGAGLDVFERGNEINPRLRNLDNVVLLPHIGSATIEGRVEMGEKVLVNIRAFADGHSPPDLVVPELN